MKRMTLIIVCAGIWLSAVCAWAAPPMVQKHIFTPGPEAEENKPAAPAAAEPKKPTIDPKLKTEILFTGVIIGPKGKIALCREAKDKNTKLQKREGDTILGLTVKRIEPNYMLLADADGKEMRFNVYQSDRKRPDAPPPPPPPAQPQAGPAGQPGQPNAPAGASGSAGGAAAAQGGQVLPGPAGAQPGQQPANPQADSQQQQNAARVNAFKEAFNKANQDRAAGKVPFDSGPPNPFQQAIQKALRP
uniref:Type II secretion system protein GspC N-terminal domain-containing protein n=1 Tax=Desulfatirhabdium butyrativorans TaxID=340467 RepID=A0A7C4RNE3_9BACT